MRILYFYLLLTSYFAYGQEKDFIQQGIKAYFNKDTIILNNSIERTFSEYKKTKDSLLLAKHFHFKALKFKLLYKNDSTYYYYQESKNISKGINDSLSVGMRLLSIAILQRGVKDYLGGEISLIEALRYLEPIKSYKYLTSVYINLGVVSKELNQKEESLGYYKKALEINEKIKDKKRQERGYLFLQNNIGSLYQRNNEHENGVTYFKKGLEFDRIKEKHPLIYALLLENLAYSNFSLDKDGRVLQQYNEVLKIRDSLNNFRELGRTHINICLFHKRKNNFSLAKQHANKALKYAKKSHNNKRWLESLEELSELSSGEQSKKYFQEYIQLNDSLLQKERSLKNQFAKIRYETDKKEKENEVLKTENEKKQEEIIKQKQQKLIGWLAAIAAFLGMGFTVTVFVFRRRKLLYQAQLQKAHAREQERKQIAKALHDEVAGDLRLLHKKLEKSDLLEEAQKLDAVKENVRNLSHQLSSVSFKKVGFKDQLINLVSDYFEPNFRILFRGLNDQDWSTFNSAVKRLLYICIRESIQNSKKHAQASEVVVTFSVHKKNVLLNITDNGIGFDTTIRKKGIGLHNLQERVEELQGTFSIESTVGNGTKTDIQIPLDV
ncbi:Tetratricopeptide repeat-containing protein [Tenacibaculum sp. MAR_2009_124]|uniref:tetratricopeptide repeat-containing sensor histidine kinase n=1 Tax=Tenacibaculum sp. MAR_2009_124 TaxID=1250059 RepID=UPI000897C587|nr:tetratricopeptide repeat-containing sensor histidine kinase [Tenacibaculum sp. MAR_2009_124]SEC48393.1 Tetratricopeptide repeat-containing protein [Tenacibaculum sp. MAR_2009_124]